MGTRCQIIIEEQGLLYNSTVWLYQHYEGYPSEVRWYIKDAHKLGERIFKKQLWKLGRAGKVASLLCATAPGLIEPDSIQALRGDIEFLYQLYLQNSKLGSTDESPTWSLDIYKPTNEFFQRPTRDNLVKVMSLVGIDAIGNLHPAKGGESK